MPSKLQTIKNKKFKKEIKNKKLKKKKKRRKPKFFLCSNLKKITRN